MSWLRFSVAAGWIGVLIVVAACREPTVITIAITTDVPCNEVGQAGGVSVRVGTPASIESNASSVVVAQDCAAGGVIGTLAIVPSNSVDDQVAIEVSVASRTAPVVTNKSVDCNPQNPGNCIIAKRVLRYIPHTALDLPIHLSLKCAGVRCTNPNETCVEGICVGVTPPCTIDNTCADASEPPRDAGTDKTTLDSPITGDGKPGFDAPTIDGPIPPDAPVTDAKPDGKPNDGSSDGPFDSAPDTSGGGGG